MRGHMTPPIANFGYILRAGSTGCTSLVSVCLTTFSAAFPRVVRQPHTWNDFVGMVLSVTTEMAVVTERLLSFLPQHIVLSPKMSRAVRASMSDWRPRIRIAIAFATGILLCCLVISIGFDPLQNLLLGVPSPTIQAITPGMQRACSTVLEYDRNDIGVYEITTLRNERMR